MATGLTEDGSTHTIKTRMIDDAHQTHPTETPALIHNSLQAFRSRLKEDNNDSTVDDEDDDDDDFLLLFLRTDVFQVDLAAQRYHIYWQKRRALWGTAAARTMELTPDDDCAFELGYVRLVQGHPRLLVMDPSRRPRHVDAASVVRSIYLTFHKALENSVELQQKGVVMVIDCGTIRSFDAKLVRLASTMLSEGFPMRQTMCCIVRLPTIASWVVHALRPFVKPQMRQRLRVVNDSPTFAKVAGLTLEEMDACIGYQPWKETS